MKTLLLLITVAVLQFITNLNLVAQSPKPAADDGRLQRYEREVQELARQFARRLQETREFRPDGDKLFIDRFTECHLLGEFALP